MILMLPSFPPPTSKKKRSRELKASTSAIPTASVQLSEISITEDTIDT